ncbi:MAG: leucyl/phenylalanyl-tRNA--protein transferase [Burkholderiales bacterium]|nr:leucyl/phenylalanyl-tRNA--protein transferase [Burkholderiales bacterium]
MKIQFLGKQDPFPPVSKALSYPDGLLAAGGDLSPQRLLSAYRMGIFPWFNAGDPILWWSPDPRLVLFPEDLKISRSLRKTLKKREFEIRVDTSFRKVMQACAAPRKDAAGTWISEKMIEAYSILHEMGHAHSIESWRDGELAGGLYGIALGSVFFGESMFSRQSDASKVAFVHLVLQLRRWGFRMIDCQVRTDHLVSLGATEIPRSQFSALLDKLADGDTGKGKWRFDHDLLE